MINARKKRHVNGPRNGHCGNTMAFGREPTASRWNISKIRPVRASPLSAFAIKRKKGDATSVSNTNYTKRAFAAFLSNRNCNVVLNHSSGRIIKAKRDRRINGEYRERSCSGLAWPFCQHRFDFVNIYERALVKLDWTVTLIKLLELSETGPVALESTKYGCDRNEPFTVVTRFRPRPRGHLPNKKRCLVGRVGIRKLLIGQAEPSSTWSTVTYSMQLQSQLWPRASGVGPFSCGPIQRLPVKRIVNISAMKIRTRCLFRSRLRFIHDSGERTKNKLWSRANTEVTDHEYSRTHRSVSRIYPKRVCSPCSCTGSSKKRKRVHLFQSHRQQSRLFLFKQASGATFSSNALRTVCARSVFIISPALFFPWLVRAELLREKLFDNTFTGEKVRLPPEFSETVTRGWKLFDGFFSRRSKCQG